MAHFNHVNQRFDNDKKLRAIITLFISVIEYIPSASYIFKKVFLELEFDFLSIYLYMIRFKVNIIFSLCWVLKSWLITFSASEVANNKKNNAPNSVPYKVRSFAKKMDDSSKSLRFKIE